MLSSDLLRWERYSLSRLSLIRRPIYEPRDERHARRRMGAKLRERPQTGGAVQQVRRLEAIHGALTQQDRGEPQVRENEFFYVDADTFRCHNFPKHVPGFSAL